MRDEEGREGEGMLVMHVTALLLRSKLEMSLRS
jgi:hypothetical protein